jgi:hypothetical protein
MHTHISLQRDFPEEDAGTKLTVAWVTCAFWALLASVNLVDDVGRHTARPALLFIYI